MCIRATPSVIIVPIYDLWGVTGVKREICKKIFFIDSDRRLSIREKEDRNPERNLGHKNHRSNTITCIPQGNNPRSCKSQARKVRSVLHHLHYFIASLLKSLKISSFSHSAATSILVLCLASSAIGSNPKSINRLNRPTPTRSDPG